MMRLRHLYTWAFICLLGLSAKAQLADTTYLNYEKPETFEIGAVDLEGSLYLEKSVLLVIANLYPGQKIRVPGDETAKAMENLWKQKFFEDVQLFATFRENGKVDLLIRVKEKPRLSRFYIKGLSRTKAKNLRDEISLKAGPIVTPSLIAKTKNEVIQYYVKKGYKYPKVAITEEPDPANAKFSVLRIDVAPGSKVMIHDITFTGNAHVTPKKLRRVMHETKRKSWNVFQWSKFKFIEADYAKAKEALVGYYNTLGFRDVAISYDSIVDISTNRIDIRIGIDEGHQYYFRNLKWYGNTKHTDKELDSILSIKKGTPYDMSLLESRLKGSPDGMDVSTLYMDEGYLFFNVMPVEVLVENDSIDIEIRIMEGNQATNNKISVKGNSKTSDYVILRELRTKPGAKFSKSDITRSMRELSQMPYFNPEQMGVNPLPNPVNGTVDIEYKVEEKASDQIELSGGWGYGSLVGVLGLTLNNFSVRKMFKAKEWTPLPGGDGQRLSIRAQSSGVYFQSYNFSFSEPWLGKRKPNAFTFNMFHSVQSNGLKTGNPNRRQLQTSGALLSLGERLKWPDDWFTAQFQLNYQRFNNYGYLGGVPNGLSNDISGRIIISRNSINDPIYPSSGSTFTLTMAATPPYSKFSGKNYAGMSESEKIKMLEYYKIKFDASWFASLFGKLVLFSRANFGFMGYYNSDLGFSPFQRFVLGGSGLTGFVLDGREILALRGYPDNGLNKLATTGTGYVGAPIYSRFTFELRHPVVQSPSATVFLLTFAEGGNVWYHFKDYNPFNIKRSVGFGARFFLPMFGLLGLDFGYNIDQSDYSATPHQWRTHFVIGQTF